jgi:serralysin
VKFSGGGYDVAWQLVGSQTFTIWSVDSNGNFIANIGNNLAGNSTALENFETIFGKDLNGDGTIGPPPPPPPTTISVDGTTTLAQSGNDYFLDVTGSNTLGPEITQGGVAATPGVYSAIYAVKLSSGGYDVAWQEVGSQMFTIWSVDSNGNFIANIGNNLAGNSTALENFETIFGQDLNGNGNIGSSVSKAGIHTTGNADSLADNFQFASGGGTSGQTSGPPGQQNTGNSAQQGAVAMTGHDGFVFVPDHGPGGGANFVHSMDFIPFNIPAFTDSHAAPAGNHEDAFNNAAIHDTAHGVQWLAHHSDFHFI